MPCGDKAGTLSTSGLDQAERDSAALAQPSPSQVSDPWSESSLRCPSPTPWGCVGALAVQSLGFFPLPAVCHEQCARCQHTWLLTVCRGALQLQGGQPYVWLG